MVEAELWIGGVGSGSIPMVGVVRLILRVWSVSVCRRSKVIRVLVCDLELRRVGVEDMSE